MFEYATALAVERLTDPWFVGAMLMTGAIVFGMAIGVLLIRVETTSWPEQSWKPRA